VQRATAEELAVRRVAEMVWCNDPLGNRVELFCGLDCAEHEFRPPRPGGGFRTGELGFGHAVLAVPRIDQVLPFYRDVLGMRMSDYAAVPFRAVFLHVNPRHHSLALLESEHAGLHHLMIEALSIDDLGRAYDAAIEQGVVRVTLGRHTNDHMLSFYSASPSGFMVEYGWGGRSIDDATWKVEEMVHGPSLWGHERSWLGEEKRAEARALRLQAAAAGLRAPVHVVNAES
jgi:2,3-dihydroxybiphenyl 1,2-dioxygenase